MEYREALLGYQVNFIVIQPKYSERPPSVILKLNLPNHSYPPPPSVSSAKYALYQRFRLGEKKKKTDKHAWGTRGAHVDRGRMLRVQTESTQPFLRPVCVLG